MFFTSSLFLVIHTVSSTHIPTACWQAAVSVRLHLFVLSQLFCGPCTLFLFVFKLSNVFIIPVFPFWIVSSIFSASSSGFHLMLTKCIRVSQALTSSYHFHLFRQLKPSLQPHDFCIIVMYSNCAHILNATCVITIFVIFKLSICLELPICLSFPPLHEALGPCVDYVCNKLKFFCCSEIW